MSTHRRVGFTLIEGPVLPNGDTLRTYSTNRYVNGTDPSNAAQSYNYMLGLNADGSTLINPVVIKVSSTSECAARPNWTMVAMRTRSTRSAMAPAMGETMTDGNSPQNTSTPTQAGEWVSSHASQSTAMRCTHNPVQHRVLAPK